MHPEKPEAPTPAGNLFWLGPSRVLMLASLVFVHVLDLDLGVASCAGGGSERHISMRGLG